MKDGPLVSVLMTAYNRSQYIGDAIESVLNSSYENFELIIVDDCSTDATAEISRQYAEYDSRVQVYVNEKNLGDYPNRNRAASYATGKYLKYLDSDNVMYPYGLASMVDSMERFPDSGYGLLSETSAASSYPVEVTPVEAYRENFIEDFSYFGRAPDSSIIRRSVFEKVGGFSGDNFIGDLEMWLRLSRTYSLVKIAPYLGWDRVHEGQQKNILPLYQKELSDSVVYESLRSINCPMSTEDIIKSIKRYKKEQWKKLFFILLSRKISLFVRMFVSVIKLHYLWRK